MIGFIIGTDAGYSSIVFYLFIYLFMNLGAFTCVILFSLRTGTDQISAYSGLYQKDPLLTLSLSLCLLSLGGNSTLSRIFRQNLHFLGWLAIRCLHFGTRGFDYKCNFHLLLHPRCQNDGGQRAARNV